MLRCVLKEANFMLRYVSKEATCITTQQASFTYFYNPDNGPYRVETCSGFEKKLVLL